MLVFPLIPPLTLNYPVLEEEGKGEERVDPGKRGVCLVIRLGRTTPWFSNTDLKTQVQDQILPILTYRVW